jgi:hypothetical protein
MGKAKNIVLRPVTAGEANELVKRVHYSGKVVQNSQLHIGVFYDGKLEGAMQFGPSLDKRKIQGLVRDTAWHEFIELNRMAFSEALPRNSESRAIAVAMRLLRQHAPQIKWVISFADGTQCGDGTIYRASGFVLTGIKANNQIWVAPVGSEGFPQQIFAGSMTMLGTKGAAKQRRQILSRVTVTKGQHIVETGAASMQPFIEAGYTMLPGFQLRYIYFVDPTYRARLTVPELPYSEIERMGARMYKGQRIQAAGAADVATDDQSGKGGLIPTPPLHSDVAEGE